MSIFDKIKSFSYSPNKNRLFGIKSAVVWGNSKTNNSSFPLLYISKPKHISIEDFNTLVNSLDIGFIKKEEGDEL